MIDLVTADKNRNQSEIRELFGEYLEWASARVNQEFNANFVAATFLEDSMQRLDDFMPPSGLLLLAYADGQLAGIGGLKKLEHGIGEIKRMYVRPALRGKGVGRALLARLLEQARRAGYRSVRLDSSRFMTEAHRLYRSAGFKDVDPYEGSEIPPEFRKHWVFMEMPLSPS